MKVEQTNFTMSKESCDQSFLADNDEDEDIIDISVSTVVDNNNTIPLYNAEKMASTILEQFFDEVKKDDVDTKFAKCLLCRTIVKQSTTSPSKHRRRRNVRTSLNQLKLKS